MNYSPAASYFKYRNLPPNIAAIARARDTRQARQAAEHTTTPRHTTTTPATRSRLYPEYGTLNNIYPTLAAQLANPATGHNLTVAGRELRWKCARNHTWTMSVYKQCLRHINPKIVYDCPTCENHRTHYINLARNGNHPYQNLFTRLHLPPTANTGYLFASHPALALLLENQNNATINPNSTRTVRWTCSWGHTWSATITDQIAAHETAETEGVSTCDRCAARERETNNTRRTINPDTTRHLYIHSITDTHGNTIAYKYGIAIDVTVRRNTQQATALTGLTLTTEHTLTATSRIVSHIESRLHRTLRHTHNLPAGLTRQQLPDGWTETISATDITLTELINHVTAIHNELTSSLVA